MHDIPLGSHVIGAGQPPFLIAELSGNHDGDFDKAVALIDAAADAGANAIKLQTYTADSMTLDSRDAAFVIDDPGSLWYGESLHALYARACTPLEWHRPLFTHAAARGLLAFSTPFSPEAVDVLMDLDVPCFKIASFENGDLDLIRRAAATGKPLIMSTGMATLEELALAVDTARSAGCRDLILLKCTSAYPAMPEEANLRVIPHLRELFDCPVGLSDHTPGIAVPVAAVALGACVVEKHLTLARAAGSVDAAFSLEPAEFAQLAEALPLTWRALGTVRYGPSPSEAASRRYRRSLYVTHDIAAGTPLTHANIRALRPALGLAPRWLDDVLARRASRDIAAGTPLTWDLLCP